jgi:hypothetical protein
VDQSLAGDHEPRTVQNGSDSDGPLMVGDIKFVKEAKGGERICIPFNRPCLPKIFSIPGKKPRIVLDVKDVSQWPGRGIIPTDGLMVQQVRMHLYKKEGKLRIVLDLDPSMDYGVVPSYYEVENVYCIDVSRK